jgi:hypothetical protein
MSEILIPVGLCNPESYYLLSRPSDPDQGWCLSSYLCVLPMGCERISPTSDSDF